MPSGRKVVPSGYSDEELIEFVMTDYERSKNLKGEKTLRVGASVMLDFLDTKPGADQDARVVVRLVRQLARIRKKIRENRDEFDMANHWKDVLSGNARSKAKASNLRSSESDQSESWESEPLELPLKKRPSDALGDREVDKKVVLEVGVKQESAERHVHLERANKKPESRSDGLAEVAGRVAKELRIKEPAAKLQAADGQTSSHSLPKIPKKGAADKTDSERADTEKQTSGSDLPIAWKFRTEVGLEAYNSRIGGYTLLISGYGSLWSARGNGNGAEEPLNLDQLRRRLEDFGQVKFIYDTFNRYNRPIAFASMDTVENAGKAATALDDRVVAKGARLRINWAWNRNFKKDKPTRGERGHDERKISPVRPREGPWISISKPPSIYPPERHPEPEQNDDSGHHSEPDRYDDSGRYSELNRYDDFEQSHNDEQYYHEPQHHSGPLLPAPYEPAGNVHAGPPMHDQFFSGNTGGPVPPNIHGPAWSILPAVPCLPAASYRQMTPVANGYLPHAPRGDYVDPSSVKTEPLIHEFPAHGHPPLFHPSPLDPRQPGRVGAAVPGIHMVREERPFPPEMKSRLDMVTPASPVSVDWSSGTDTRGPSHTPISYIPVTRPVSAGASAMQRNGASMDGNGSGLLFSESAEELRREAEEILSKAEKLLQRAEEIEAREEAQAAALAVSQRNIGALNAETQPSKTTTKAWPAEKVHETRSDQKFRRERYSDERDRSHRSRSRSRERHHHSHKDRRGSGGEDARLERHRKWSR